MQGGSFIICPTCKNIVYSEDGRYHCKHCDKEIKPKPTMGWGGQ